jgi:hypothetical protein
VEPKHARVLGRVAVTRALRLDRAPAAAPAPPASTAPRSSDVLCPRCGASLCGEARRALFAGMVLRCGGCGATARVQR